MNEWTSPYGTTASSHHFIWRSTLDSAFLAIVVRGCGDKTGVWLKEKKGKRKGVSPLGPMVAGETCLLSLSRAGGSSSRVFRALKS